jgi:hypothetical protein
MEHMVWSKVKKGEKVEKSFKCDNPNLKEKEKESQNKEKEIKEKTSELIKSDLVIGDTFINRGNKRELANTKLNDRNLISQIGQNPFMTNNNYLHDLEVQQNFLIPQNSNFT